TGLYVFRTNPNYGILKVRVVDPTTGLLPGADVTAMGETDSTRTQGSGAVRLALSPGSHTLRVKKFGYTSVIWPVSLAKGAHDSILVTLQPEPLATVTGGPGEARTRPATKGPISRRRTRRWVWSRPAAAPTPSP